MWITPKAEKDKNTSIDRIAIALSNLLNRHYYRAYLLAFFIVFLFAYALPYLATGNELMTTGDGLRQHFVWFAYIGRSLREGFRSLTSGNGFIFPFWDHTIGFGSDVITTGGLYFGDPLTYLSVFCPTEYSEYLYNALIVVRMAFAGATFSYFMRQHVQDNGAVLCGALIYCMGWHIAMAIVHPLFLNVIAYTPMIYAGIDKIYNGNSPATYIAFVALAIMSSYSLAFMACVLAIPYCVVYFIYKDDTHTISAFLTRFLQIMIPTLGSIAIAGCILIPTLIAQMQSSRADIERSFGLLYMDTAIPVYYLNLLSGFFAGGKAESLYGQIGIGPVGVLSCIGLFYSKGKQYRPYKIGMCLVTVCALFPICGYILNAGIYPSDRWMFLFAFMCCAVIAKVLPKLPTIIHEHMKGICVSIGIIIVVLLAVPMTRRIRVVASALLVITFVWSTYKYKTKKMRPHVQNSESRAQIQPIPFLATPLVVLSLALLATNIMLNKAPSEKTGNKIDFGQAIELQLTESPGQMVRQANGGDLTDARYDESGVSILPNSNQLTKLMGFNFYKSTYNENINQFLKSLGVATHADFLSSFLYSDLDSRTLVEAVSGTKYFLTSKGAFGRVPFGYNYIDSGEAGAQPYDIYQTDNEVGLAYGVTNYIDLDDYKKMPSYKAQEALLQGVCMESEDAKKTGLSQANLKYESEVIPYSIEYGEGVYREGDEIEVTKPGAMVTLTFDGLPDSETYILVDSVSAKLGPAAISQKNDQPTGVLDLIREFYEKGVYSIYNTTLGYWNTSAISLSFRSAVRSNGMTNIPLSNNNYYGGQSNYLVNMGYSEDAQTYAEISFSNVGRYSFRDLKVVCQPMSLYRENVKKISERSAEVTTGVNRIDGSIDMPSSGAIYLSIPYSAGWKAFIDGSEVSPVKANIAFMVLPVEAGEHSFYLEYRPPYLPISLTCTVIGLSFSIFYAIRVKKRNSVREEGRVIQRDLDLK